MKKLYSLLVLMLLGMTAAWATDVTFTAGTDTGETSVTKDGVTVSCSTMSRTDNYRVYKNTALTISSTAGDITRVEITGVAGNPASNMTAPTAGSWSTSGNDGTWTGSASEFSLTASVAQARITKIVVTIGGGGGPSVATPVISGTTPFTDQTEVTISCATQDNDLEIYYTLDGATPSTSSTLYQGAFTITESCTVKAIAFVGEIGSSVASKDFVKKEPAPAVTTLAQVWEANKDLAKGAYGDEFTFDGAVGVVYQHGNYLYIQDETGNALIYGANMGTFNVGDVLNSGWTAKAQNYNGLIELQGATLAGVNATVSYAPVITTLTIGEITNDMQNKYVKLEKMTVGTYSSKNFDLTDEQGNKITGRDGIGLFTGSEAQFGSSNKYDVTGFVANYNGTLQLYAVDFTKVEGGDTPQLYTVHIDDGMVYGTVSANPMEAAAGATITLTITPDAGYKLLNLEVKGASGAPIEYAVGTTANIYTFEMPASDAYVNATFEEEDGKHELTYAIIGVTGSTYTAWTGIGGGTSDAVYAGKTAGGNNAIQLRSNKSEDGIVTTTSAGLVRKVSIVWNSNTAATRTVQIYGKNEAYSSAADLYTDAKGDLLGEINIDENTLMVTVKGDYAYWGIRSKSGALYLDAIDVEWEEGEVPPTPEYQAPTILINGEAPAASYKESELPLTLSIADNNGVESPRFAYSVNHDVVNEASSGFQSTPFELNLGDDAVLDLSLGTNTIQVLEYVDWDNEIAAPVASVTFTVEPNPVVVNSIAEFAAQEDGKQFEFGTRVNVIAQTADKKYTYVQDENNGMILYNSKGIDQEYGMGNVIPAGFSGTKTVFRGQLEMQNPEGLEPATSTIELTPLEATLADVNAGNFGRYAVLRGVNINYENNTGYVVSGDASVELFDRFGVGLPEDLSPQFDVYGIISIYNDNLQFLPLDYKTVEPEVPHAIILDVEGQGQILVGDGLTEALAGTDVSFRVIGDEGWRIEVNNDLHVTYLGVDDEPVEIGLSYWVAGDEEGYSFVMPDADVTISAVFEQYLYNIVKDVTVGGDVEVQETADVGALIFFTAVPAEHYELYQIVITYEDETGEPVNVDYQAEEDENTYSFFMPAADVNLLVEFAELPLYGITYNVENVTVEGPESAYAEDEVVFTVTPDEGYILKSIDASYIPANGESNVAVAIQLEGPDADGAYSFVMPAGRVAINIIAEEDLPHLTLAQVLTEGVAGQTYYIDNDVAIYTEGVTVPRVGSMYFITDNEGTYMPIGVPTVLNQGWPKAGLAAGFKAMAYDLRGERILVFVDGQDIDMLYVVDEQAVDRVFEPINYKVYRLNGFVQEVDGELYLSEFSGLNGSIQASCHLVTENVTLDITDFEQGKRYEFIAVPAPKNVYNNHAPQRTQAELQKREFVVISSAVSVITGIENLNADDAVSVTYVNMQGAVSDRPFDGVNIVVTQHADGSVTTVKVLK